MWKHINEHPTICLVNICKVNCPWVHALSCDFFCVEVGWTKSLYYTVLVGPTQWAVFGMDRKGNLKGVINKRWPNGLDQARTHFSVHTNCSERRAQTDTECKTIMLKILSNRIIILCGESVKTATLLVIRVLVILLMSKQWLQINSPCTIGGITTLYVVTPYSH